jgi:hypothetical protein
MPKRHACAWIALVAAGGAAMTAGAQVWKDKRIAEWSEEEARQVLTDSPWAKTATPARPGSSGAGNQPVSVGRSGIGVGPVGVGLPGLGGLGGRGGVRRGPGSGKDTSELPTLTLRWASAMPVISAELIAREVNAPSVDEGHYAIAVYGIPSSEVHGDPKSVSAELKRNAVLKREGKKDMKPSSVEVLMHDEGPVILYLFPRSNEITREDKRLEFAAEIGRLKLTQDFLPDEMVYQGKLEL